MDDASPIAAKDPLFKAAIKTMDAEGGFATVQYEGREIILMSAEKFEEWEDAVDSAAIVNALSNPDPEGRRTLGEVAEEFGIVLPSQRQA